MGFAETADCRTELIINNSIKIVSVDPISIDELNSIIFFFDFQLSKDSIMFSYINLIMKFLQGSVSSDHLSCSLFMDSFSSVMKNVIWSQSRKISQFLLDVVNLGLHITRLLFVVDFSQQGIPSLLHNFIIYLGQLLDD